MRSGMERLSRQIADMSEYMPGALPVRTSGLAADHQELQDFTEHLMEQVHSSLDEIDRHPQFKGRVRPETDSGYQDAHSTPSPTSFPSSEGMYDSNSTLPTDMPVSADESCPSTRDCPSEQDCNSTKEDLTLDATYNEEPSNDVIDIHDNISTQLEEPRIANACQEGMIVVYGRKRVRSLMQTMLNLAESAKATKRSTPRLDLHLGRLQECVSKLDESHSAQIEAEFTGERLLAWVISLLMVGKFMRKWNAATPDVDEALKRLENSLQNSDLEQMIEDINEVLDTLGQTLGV
jgi:hypothetical protein